MPSLRSRNAILAIAALLVLTLGSVPGCGGRSGGGGTTGGATGGTTGIGGVRPGDKTMTPEAITTVLGGADAAFSDIVNATQDQTERSDQMAAWLKTRPEFAASGIVSPGNVWGRLVNGHLYYATTQYIPGEDPPRSATDSPRPAAVASRGGFPTLPESTQARVLSSLDASLFGTTDVIAGMLSDHNYDVIQQRATLDRLKSISGDGVFYWDTHGGIGRDDRGKANFWTAVSDDAATGSAIIANRADLDKGRLIYCTVAYARDSEGKIVMRSTFGITQPFIEFYKWSFGRRALLFLNCCYSAVSGMTTDMSARTVAGEAGQAFGWGEAVPTDTASRSANYAFDRMLGVNQFLPAETVPQRPFDSSTVYGEMGSHDELVHGGKAYLLLSTDGDHVSLAPSIEKMVVAERVQESPLKGKSKLTIEGIFGEDEGKVQIDGVEVPVTSWATDKIECTPADLPGPGFAGDVVVTSKDRKSNSVPLTQWRGTVTYDIDVLPAIAGGVHSQLVCDVTFRGDVHRYRYSGGHDPSDPEPFDFRAAQGSTANWTLSGSPPAGTWSSPTTASLPFGLNGTVAPPYGTGYIVSGHLDSKAGKAAFSFSYLGLGAQYTTTAGAHGMLVTIRDPLLAAIATGVGSDGYPKYSNNLALGLSAEDGLIPGQEFTGSTPLLNPKLKVSDFVATHFPDPAKGEDDKD